MKISSVLEENNIKFEVFFI